MAKFRKCALERKWGRLVKIIRHQYLYTAFIDGKGDFMTCYRTQSLPIPGNAFTPVENEFLYKHIALSIERLLNNPDDAQLEYLFEKPADAVRDDLKARLLRGEQYITTSTCSNFCSEKGCMGHMPE